MEPKRASSSPREVASKEGAQGVPEAQAKDTDGLPHKALQIQAALPQETPDHSDGAALGPHLQPAPTARRGPDPQAGLPLASHHHVGPELPVQGPLFPPRAGLKAQAASYMMSTKNSQGFPMAFWKDWRLPVNSGGTAASSRTGGPPGGPPTTA